MTLRYTSFERWRAHTIQLELRVTHDKHMWRARLNGHIIGYFNTIKSVGELTVKDSKTLI